MTQIIRFTLQVTFSLVILFFSFKVTAGVLPNQVPNQEQAISTAQHFLTELDAGRMDTAYGDLGIQAKSMFPFSQFIAQQSTMRNQLGGPSYERKLVQESPSNTLPTTRSQGLFFSLRFRSTYPVGAVFEDVTLFFEGYQRWTIVNIWFSPASY